VALRVVGDEADLEPARLDGADGQAHAVDGDRALLDDVAVELLGQRDPHDGPVLLRRHRQHLAGAVDVPLHDVAARAGR
jgi:hypothetical protein